MLSEAFPKPPARLTRRGEEKRALILKTATGMFLEHGYDGVSLDEVVRTTGGSKTNVYNYFGGKDGLFVAVVEALCDRFLESSVRVDLSRINAAVGLQKIAHSFLQTLLQESHLAFLRLIIAECRRFPQLGDAWYTRGPIATCNYIAAFLATQEAAGAKLRATPDVAAQMFHSMVIGGVLHRALATAYCPSESELKAIVVSATALIVSE
ncbi:TetR/AcrR family transcriptional regulator [Cupriavidus basilensis]|uniref:TetR/AcrR family transcriptional regulator n=1 Tax=Cupriavidus basilensis TaxID=68895 RepID=UPI0023E78E81|nr:TetR/AcrR family transcriptional regulator [Cupriavidus basilensis]MDF3887558.1 TetR/AcrR family transcriptional regulator [Cupriavidus basilensis]